MLLKTLRSSALLLSVTLMSMFTGPATVSDSRTDPVEQEVEPSTDPVEQEAEPSTDRAVDPAVESLMEDYGLSAVQAAEQMDAQVAAGQAERDLPAGLAAVFSDREIRHEKGGRVVVALTSHRRVEAMTEHFAKYGINDIDTQIVEHSDEQLNATADAMQRRLIKSRSPKDEPRVEVGRGALGMVTIEFTNAPMNATEKDILSEARSNRKEFVVSETNDIEVGEEDACDRTGNIECDPPL